MYEEDQSNGGRRQITKDSDINGLVDEMAKALDWDGGALSYMARTLAQGAISGKAQQINGAALGQMIGSGASNISRASKAYNSSLTKAIQWAGGE